jgi:hypothetical protein
MEDMAIALLKRGNLAPVGERGKRPGKGTEPGSERGDLNTVTFINMVPKDVYNATSHVNVKSFIEYIIHSRNLMQCVIKPDGFLTTDGKRSEKTTLLISVL